MKTHILFCLIFLLTGSCLDACTMTPSVWRVIEEKEISQTPTTYGLVEAFYQIKRKLEKELIVLGLPIKPINFMEIVGQGGELSLEARSAFAEAADVIWKDALILPSANLSAPIDNASIYRARVNVLQSKSTKINMIDLNPQVFELLRFVVRDELRLHVSIMDEEDLPVLVDEIEVSPTIVIDPLLSPIGGYLIRIEKNNMNSTVIDFGSVEEGGEHIVRTNYTYNAPEKVPPMQEFKSELLLKVEEKERLLKNKQFFELLAGAVATQDVDYFSVILDTFLVYDINTKGENGDTILHLACGAGNLDILKVLLAKEPDLTLVNDSNETLLHLAVEKDFVTGVEILLRAGAEKHRKNNQGLTPMDIALQRQNKQMLSLLK
jgi:hypothetical protein